MVSLFKQIENNEYVDSFLEAYQRGDRFIVFDTEFLQGKGSENQHVWEIGGVEAGKDFTESPKTFQELLYFNTDNWRQYWYCLKVCRISKEEMLSGENREETIKKFLEFCKGTDESRKTTLITHTKVDIRAIRREILRHESLIEEWHENDLWDNYFDSHKLAKCILPEKTGYSISKLTEHFDLTNENAHRALEDAIVTKKIVAKMIGVHLKK
jgi:DNA polymerase III epsilon subunit-like protein